jgi:RHS repeat-associated protein
LRLEHERRQLTGEPGRLDQVSEWGGGRFQYTYDAQGDLTVIVEANDRRRSYTYDRLRRLTAVQHPDGSDTGYTYEGEHLARINDRGVITTYRYDRHDRIAQIQPGQAGASVYEYDQHGRVILARTAQVTTRWRYDMQGRITALEQAIDGVTLRAALTYNHHGRLALMALPGSDCPIYYTWDDRGRPHTVSIGAAVIARFAYLDATKTTNLGLGNGVAVETVANSLDGRCAQQTVHRSDTILQARTLTYNEVGEITGDGQRSYAYDILGRLVSVEDQTYGTHWHVAYDSLDNRTALTENDAVWRYDYDADSRLTAMQSSTGATMHMIHDRWGRLTAKLSPTAAWTYRYDDAGHLQEARCDGMTMARFLYDHKGRLVFADFGTHVERYLYGPADELLAVTDAAGQPLRLFVRTPFGVLAEVSGPLGDGNLYYHHTDEQGTLHLITDRAGAVVDRFEYSPFGEPLASRTQTPEESASEVYRPAFAGRLWYAEIALAYFGARWYDPALGRFLTPDSYTGAPDDMRLLNPLHPSSHQAARRNQILRTWLQQPRVRNPYTFCANDPVSHVDPTGHWSFGGVLLTLLGVIWTLPNTLFGLLIEITCLVGEVIRWLVWLVTAGHVSWETPGFDVAASGHLNAFALVFSGGWLGSFSSLLGITFGNVFFVYKDWRNSPHITSQPDPIYPPAYGGTVAIPRDKMLYEHELRHTNQYGWLGPFFHLGLPLFGVYEWEVILNGYQNAWLERDAREHAEP